MEYNFHLHSTFSITHIYIRDSFDFRISTITFISYFVNFLWSNQMFLHSDEQLRSLRNDGLHVFCLIYSNDLSFPFSMDAKLRSHPSIFIFWAWGMENLGRIYLIWPQWWCLAVANLELHKYKMNVKNSFSQFENEMINT